MNYQPPRCKAYDLRGPGLYEFMRDFTHPPGMAASTWRTVGKYNVASDPPHTAAVYKGTRGYGFSNFHAQYRDRRLSAFDAETVDIVVKLSRMGDSDGSADFSIVVGQQWDGAFFEEAYLCTTVWTTNISILYRYTSDQYGWSGSTIANGTVSSSTVSWLRDFAYVRFRYTQVDATTVNLKAKAWDPNEPEPPVDVWDLDSNATSYAGPGKFGVACIGSNPFLPSGRMLSYFAYDTTGAPAPILKETTLPQRPMIMGAIQHVVEESKRSCVRIPYTSQPPDGTPLRKDTSLAQGIYVAMHNGLAVGVQANGYPTQIVDTYKLKPTELGRAYTNTKTPKNGIKWAGLPTPRPTNKITAISIARVLQTSPGGDYSPFVGIWANASGWQAELAALQCIVWNGQRDCRFNIFTGTNLTTQNGVASADVGVWYIHVGRWRSGDYAYYKRFNLSTMKWETEYLSSTTRTGALYYGSDGERTEITSAIGIQPNYTDSDGLYPLNHDNLLSVIWSRYLEDDELDQLVENPWQIFEPRKIWVDSSPYVQSVAQGNVITDDESPWIITGKDFGAR